jgi:oligopeptidase B
MTKESTAVPGSRLAALILLALAAGTLLAGCSGEPKVPVAAIHPYELTAHGDTRIDNYYWLNQRDNPEVIAYLEAENAYLAAKMIQTEDLQATLFAEMKARVKPDDASAPVVKNGYWYYTRFVEGGEYPLHCRRAGSLDGPEEIMLDGNRMGEGKGYFALRGVSASPDGKQLAWAEDMTGRRLYTLRFKDLASGQPAAESIPLTTGNVVWANDNLTVFYGRQDPETLRSYQIWRHRVGTDPAGDVLVFEEKDDTFECSVQRSKSDQYLFITSDQTLSTEVRLLAADNPTGTFRVFQPRQRDVEYEVEQQGDRFVVRTNLLAPNFRLMSCGLAETWLANWQEIVPHRAEVLLENFEVFNNWLVLTERFDGLSHLRIVPMDGSADHTPAFTDPTWAVDRAANLTMDTDELRFVYESPTTPETTYSYNMANHTRTVVKQKEVVGGYNPDDYVAEYLHVPARDGVLVPVSLVYRKGFKHDGSAPLLLYAYGSYGYSTDAGFDASRLSLLDRGFVFAIAHIRGGQEMGRQWYEDGKLLNKMNTFTDFIDCGEYLVQQKYTQKDRLFALGGSAGGLLMGAVANMAPDLWRGIVAAVPFVDVVTTMLDESIPLTTGEYDEWGNPNEKPYYEYMLGYSPYDQVSAQAYPALLVTTGLHDSQVQYFEPAKWVAKLRAMKTDDNPLLFKINMEAGHGGKSGRYRRLEENALVYAFILDLAGIGK